MRIFTCGLVGAFERIFNESGAICGEYFLCKDGFHAAVRSPCGDMRTINGDGSSVMCSVETEDEFFLGFDGDLEENVCRRIVSEPEIGFGDVDCGIHTVRLVVLDRVGMIPALGNFLPGIECRAEECCRNLANATAEFRESLSALDDEFGEVSMFAIHFAQMLHERELFSGCYKYPLELFDGAFDIENPISRGS